MDPLLCHPFAKAKLSHVQHAETRGKWPSIQWQQWKHNTYLRIGILVRNWSLLKNQLSSPYPQASSLGHEMFSRHYFLSHTQAVLACFDWRLGEVELPATKLISRLLHHFLLILYRLMIYLSRCSLFLCFSPGKRHLKSFSDEVRGENHKVVSEESKTRESGLLNRNKLVKPQDSHLTGPFSKSGKKNGGYFDWGLRHLRSENMDNIPDP